MVYVLTLSTGELEENLNKLRTEMRLTKAIPKNIQRSGELASPPIVLVLSQAESSQNPRLLEWIGVVARHNTVGAVDSSITIDPLRPCLETVSIDGSEGVLGDLPQNLQVEFTQAALPGSVGICGHALWEALNEALRARHPSMADLIDWLLAQAYPPIFNESDPADRAWQEQREATGCLLRIADFPLSALAAWRRPASDDAPYLAGLIPQPVEQSLIEHDIRVSGTALGMFDEWWVGGETRCDIHVLWDSGGRRLEIANVNSTPVEFRTGTDMIYYHEPTQSFILVQYKRLDPQKRSMYVDKRFYSQLGRLEEIAKLSRSATKPSEWRLANDSCFMKLAYWPQAASENTASELSPGMYLPVSYVRILLNDKSTWGIQADSTARILGYDQVERHLVSTQFIELVKHGLAGTVGVTAEQLRELVSRQIDDGQSVMVAAESSSESVRQREARLRKRGAKDRSYMHSATRRHEPELAANMTTPDLDSTRGSTLF